MYLPATKFHIVTAEFLVSVFNLAACSIFFNIYIILYYSYAVLKTQLSLCFANIAKVNLMRSADLGHVRCIAT